MWVSGNENREGITPMIVTGRALMGPRGRRCPDRPLEPLPEIVTDQRDALAAGFGAITLDEVAAHLWADSEQREQAWRDRGADHALRCVLGGERQVAIDDALHRFEASSSCSNVEEVGYETSESSQSCACVGCVECSVTSRSPRSPNGSGRRTSPFTTP